MLYRLVYNRDLYSLVLLPRFSRLWERKLEPLGLGGPAEPDNRNLNVRRTQVLVAPNKDTG